MYATSICPKTRKRLLRVEAGEFHTYVLVLRDIALEIHGLVASRGRFSSGGRRCVIRSHVHDNRFVDRDIRCYGELLFPRNNLRKRTLQSGTLEEYE